MKQFKKSISYTILTLLTTFLISCGNDARNPVDEVHDSKEMIVYYSYEVNRERYKYEYRITDGLNDSGFKFFTNKVFKVGDTIYIGK